MQKKYTKNIHIYPVNNKFNKSIFSIDDERYSINSMASQSSLYKYLYTNENLQNKEILQDNMFIFNSSILNYETIDFIKNFCSIYNMWIFLDNETTIPSNLSNIKYITLQHIDNINSKILPINIIDSSIYSNIQPVDKIDQLVYFFDTDTDSINAKLEQYLYPKSNYKIKLFDNNKFSHPQNLGYLNEQNKFDILRESKFYICNNNYYKTEAMVCGCSIINLDDERSMEEQITNNRPETSVKFTYYINFLEELYDEK